MEERHTFYLDNDKKTEVVVTARRRSTPEVIGPVEMNCSVQKPVNSTYTVSQKFDISVVVLKASDSFETGLFVTAAKCKMAECTAGMLIGSAAGSCLEAQHLVLPSDEYIQ